MKSTEKEKMCPSCEGRIPYRAEVCPYCATDQMSGGVHNSFKAPLFQNQTLEDSLTSLYTPPYQGRKPQFSRQVEPEAEESPQSMYKEVTEPFQEAPLIGSDIEEEKELQKSALWPTLLLIAGMNFAILGLMQLFFSKNGVLRLEWNAHYWFFYCLLSTPLFYFGLKKLKELS